MPRGNVENLKPVKSKEEARERGRNGGIASGERRREIKSFKEELKLALSIIMEDGKSMHEHITLALLNEAKKGDVRAYETVRDTMGEAPDDKSNVAAPVVNIVLRRSE
jgi:hydroxymethylpyrimidine pyrophosphatase-like HAD family hydrolase